MSDASGAATEVRQESVCRARPYLCEQAALTHAGTTAIPKRPGTCGARLMLPRLAWNAAPPCLRARWTIASRAPPIVSTSSRRIRTSSPSRRWTRKLVEALRDDRLYNNVFLARVRAGGD